MSHIPNLDMDHHIGDLHPFIVGTPRVIDSCASYADSCSTLDREIEIIQNLLAKILVHEEIISRVCDVCAELDCLLCFAEASGAFSYVRPRVTNDNVIDICQGRYVNLLIVEFRLTIVHRHPLLEQIVDTFIPNDIVLRGGCGINAPLQNDGSNNEDSDETPQVSGRSVIVCTGANSCGKVCKCSPST